MNGAIYGRTGSTVTTQRRHRLVIRLKRCGWELVEVISPTGRSLILLGAVRHNRINRGKGRFTDTLIVVVFGRIGSERGGAERNMTADYVNRGGQVGKGQAVRG